jgi:hypothetical protein
MASEPDRLQLAREALHLDLLSLLGKANFHSASHRISNQVSDI